MTIAARTTSADSAVSHAAEPDPDRTDHTGSRLRVLPVPVSEPQTASALRRGGVTVPATQGTLALSFQPDRPCTAGRDREFGRQPTASCDLPDPRTTCAALVQAVVEVLAGTRPAAQLVRWLSSDVYASIARRAALAARMRRGSEPSGRQAVVRGVRVCEPADGVVEGCAVVLVQDRVRAVAVRLEGLDGRWRATAIEIG